MIKIVLRGVYIIPSDFGLFFVLIVLCVSFFDIICLPEWLGLNNRIVHMIYNCIQFSIRSVWFSRYIYWKEKETHILTFKTSDLLWVQILSCWQHFIPTYTHNESRQQISLIFADDTFYLRWRFPQFRHLPQLVNRWKPWKKRDMWCYKVYITISYQWRKYSTTDTYQTQQ